MTRATPTDEELLRRIADRDEHAFGELHRRHAAAAHAIAARVSHCQHDAEDATQDAFFALWRDAARFRPRPGGSVAWLQTIVRNRAIDARRQAEVRNRRLVFNERALAELPSGRLAPDEAVTGEQARALLHAAIAALPAPQRDVIVLAYVHDLTQTEIAVRRSVALGTVKSRTRLALDRLACDPTLSSV